MDKDTVDFATYCIQECNEQKKSVLLLRVTPIFYFVY